MCQACTTHRCCPRNRYTEGLDKYNLSRLNRTAFVLASYASCTGRPNATQGWLLAAGQLYQVGVFSHWVMQEGFKVLLLFSSFSRLTLARDNFTSFIVFSLAVGPAFVVDIVPPGNVEKGASLFQSMYWIGNIAGMACVGYAFEKLGITIPVLASCLFPIAGLSLLLADKSAPPLSDPTLS